MLQVIEIIALGALSFCMMCFVGVYLLAFALVWEGIRYRMRGGM